MKSSGSGEHEGVASNGKMAAVPWAGAGSIAVFNIDNAKQFDANIPLLKGHRGAVQDMQWSHFEDRLLASSADDGIVKFWIFDDYEGV